MKKVITGSVIHKGIMQVEKEIKLLEKALAYLQPEMGEDNLPYRTLDKLLLEKWESLTEFEKMEFEEVSKGGQ